MNIEEFYKQDTQRASSRELDYGVWWRSSKDTCTYRISFVDATGEFYSLNYRTNEVRVIGHADSEEHAERLLEGWADACGSPASLDWAIERLTNPANVVT